MTVTQEQSKVRVVTAGREVSGFGSSLTPTPRNDSQRDVFSSVTQGLGKLSVVAASAAQSAANVVQASTMELTTKVFYDNFKTRLYDASLFEGKLSLQANLHCSYVHIFINEIMSFYQFIIIL
ncbi:putative ADP-ribosylation factor GTPase-activating protein AGD6/7 [Helianthus annuus]|nr:putative ADP-ribosylation factor GTPase-activating protein AGD6/7 [Helianthus annuus]KAJ0705751.1 putative ADP-ribosylation factor GTPase-activating protein AGD6/7 [Helianthus annuus]